MPLRHPVLTVVILGVVLLAGYGIFRGVTHRAPTAQIEDVQTQDETVAGETTNWTPQACCKRNTCATGENTCVNYYGPAGPLETDACHTLQCGGWLLSDSTHIQQCAAACGSTTAGGNAGTTAGTTAGANAGTTAGTTAGANAGTTAGADAGTTAGNTAGGTGGYCCGSGSCTSTTGSTCPSGALYPEISSCINACGQGAASSSVATSQNGGSSSQQQNSSSTSSILPMCPTGQDTRFTTLAGDKDGFGIGLDPTGESAAFYSNYGDFVPGDAHSPDQGVMDRPLLGSSFIDPLSQYAYKTDNMIKQPSGYTFQFDNIGVPQFTLHLHHAWIRLHMADVDDAGAHPLSCVPDPMDKLDLRLWVRGNELPHAFDDVLQKSPTSDTYFDGMAWVVTIPVDTAFLTGDPDPTINPIDIKIDETAPATHDSTLAEAFAIDWAELVVDNYSGPACLRWPQCDDGTDNDHDGLIDTGPMPTGFSMYWADPGCTDAQDDDEAPVNGPDCPAGSSSSGDASSSGKQYCCLSSDKAKSPTCGLITPGLALTCQGGIRYDNPSCNGVCPTPPGSSSSVSHSNTSSTSGGTGSGGSSSNGSSSSMSRSSTSGGTGSGGSSSNGNGNSFRSSSSAGVRSSSRSNTTPPICGNGTREAPEACDDGNRDPGDGCSPTCTIENGLQCLLR